MRRTLGLALALPVTLILASGVTTPEEELPAPTGSSAGPADIDPQARSRAALLAAAEPASPVASDASPPAGEVGDVGPRPDPAMERDDRSASDRSGEGFLVADVPDAGGVSGTGPRWRYSVEVDPATGLDPDDVARQIRTALTDERSWARERTLEQVAEPAKARIRIVIATPASVDALCARAGLRTVGIYSCWNGRFAALNAWRWAEGADGFDDIATYRTYLVNHEFGHGLGYGHVGCSAPGTVAPVMMQQSKGLDGCIANGWPYP